MAVIVCGPRPAFGEGDELVAGVDERHPAPAPAQLYLEDAPVKVEGLLNIADHDSYVVEPDQPGA